jgi:hypothetical protein
MSPDMAFLIICCIIFWHFGILTRLNITVSGLFPLTTTQVAADTLFVYEFLYHVIQYSNLQKKLKG